MLDRLGHGPSGPDDPAGRDADHALRWPAGFSPRCADAWARSRLVIKADPAVVFSRLVTPGHWERDFSGIRNVRFPAPGDGFLELDSEFEFVVDGLRLDARVIDLADGRLAWFGQGTDISVYHAWLVSAGPGRSSAVLTGFAARGAAAVALTEPDPGRTHALLARWVRDLKKAAERRRSSR
jgi:hypothetical protein